MVFRGGSNISGVSIGWRSYQLQLLLLLMSTRRSLLGNASEKTICIHSIRSKLDFPKSNMFGRSVAISCRYNLDERIPVCANIGDASTIQNRRPASWLGERLNLKPGYNSFLKNSTLGIPHCKIFAQALFTVWSILLLLK